MFYLNLLCQHFKTKEHEQIFNQTNNPLLLGRDIHCGLFWNKWRKHRWANPKNTQQVETNATDKKGNGYFLDNVFNTDNPAPYNDNAESTRTNYRYLLKFATFTKH